MWWLAKGDGRELLRYWLCRYKKDSSLSFYRFLLELQHRKTWVKAVSRAKWSPSSYNYVETICAKKSSNNPGDIDLISTIFSDHKGQKLNTPKKRGGEQLECLKHRKKHRLE